MDLKEFDLVDPSTHWYYQSKLFALRKELAQHGHGVQHVIDVGAGSGFFSKEMTKERIFINVLCIDPNYTREQLT